MTLNYSPGSFLDLYKTKLGERLWAYLNEQESIVRMETASYLGRPAAEALSPGLLKTFGDEVRADRVKQMIGNMIRQIVEQHGYQIDRQNVRIPEVRKELFTSATRYKRDPNFEKAMEIARRGMDVYRNALAELAK